MNGDRAALVLMVGPPASGKSTEAAARFPLPAVFSLDQFRTLLCGDKRDMAATPAALALLRTVVEFRMQRRMTTVVDATNTHVEGRAPLVAFARDWGLPVVAMVIATPREVCRARNAARGPATVAPYPGANTWPVPEHALDEFADELAKAPPTADEVDAVVTIRDGAAVDWQGRLPAAVLAEPWLADAAALAGTGCRSE